MNHDAFVLEQGKPLSESAIWRMGREYFDEQGEKAWSSKTVPSNITNSPFIAHASARIVLSYLRDCVHGRHPGSPSAIDPAKPIYIVELASGAGRFSFLFLKKFLQIKAASSLKKLDVRFVMTDFTLTNIHTWMKQPWFQPFLESGALDFARFDMDQSEQLELLRSGEVLTPGTLANPLMVLGNYALCVVPHDLFRISENELHRGLITISSRKTQRIEDVDVKRLNDLNLDFSYQKVEGSCYGNPEIDRILETHRAQLPDQIFLFPICALRCFERLANIAGGRMLALVSDLGSTLESEFKLSPKDKPIQIYGSPVAGVNFQALRQYFVNRGGLAAVTSQHGLTLKTAALILGSGERGTEQFADTLLEFQESIERFGPSNFEHLRNALSQRELMLETLLELLRISDWDPQTFLSCAQALPGQIFFSKQPILSELKNALEKLWENFHPLNGDLPFELARTYLALGLPHQAIRFCELSLQLFGDHPATRYNLGLSQYRAGDLSAALASLAQAIELRPDFACAQLLRARALTSDTLPPETFLRTSEKD